MTKKQAKELSIKKWEYIVKNNGNMDGLTKKFPELKYLSSGCGYCELYIKTSSPKFNVCAKCPIRPKLKDWEELGGFGDYFGCLKINHPYKTWNRNSTKENAQAVLDLILKS